MAMPSDATHPLDIIAAPPPQFSADEAAAIAAEHYGLTVRASPLTSERDQNFLLTTPDETRYVLKIANAAEDPQVADFQVQALKHIAAQGPSRVAVPRVVETRDGASHFALRAGDATHTARLVTHLDGDTLDAANLSAPLCRELGGGLAWLGAALSGFTHAGARQQLLWDLGQAAALRDLLHYVKEPATRDLVEASIDDFEERVASPYGALRAQVVHNDMNPANVLLDSDNPERFTGLIDFGDMLHAPLVSDVAVAASYLRAADGNPLGWIAEFVAGYHAVQPLERREIDLLYDLINTRLAATVAILHWRRAERAAGDAYLESATAGEERAAAFLARLRELPRRHATSALRQVCASVTEAA